jgi:DNA-binding NarL/FixJ family response regulator
MNDEKCDLTRTAQGLHTTMSAVESPARTAAPAVRVWLVDDNEGIRTMVAELLGLMGGIDCARHFSSPDEVLSALASKPGPDVILLDVQMGDRNGLDAVRPIKSLTRSTRVLMFTTSNNEAWRERALHEGASDYLLKSDAMERVAARIRNAADDPAPVQSWHRRPSCPSPRPMQMSQASSTTDRAPRLLSRTLRMLRRLSN